MQTATKLVRISSETYDILRSLRKQDESMGSVISRLVSQKARVKV